MENIDSDLIRGNIDTIILKTMLDGDKYGLDIIKEVEQRSNGTYELKQPTLYSCLKRLENQELISSYWLDSDIGGRRHYYKLTEKGHDQLTKKQEEWSRSKFIIDNLLSNYNVDDYRLVSKEDYERIIEGKQFVYQSPSDNGQSRSNNSQTTEPFAETEPEIQTENETQIETLSESKNDFEDISNDVTETEDTAITSATLTEPETENIDDHAEDADSAEPATDHVYVSSNSAESEAYKTTGSAPEPAPDLRSFENNILASLRRQENEDINTYVGDKNSYVKGLKTSEVKILPEADVAEQPAPDYEVVQENLLDSSETTSKSELDSHLNNFSESVNELTKFLSHKDEPNQAAEPETSAPEETHESAEPQYDYPSASNIDVQPETSSNEATYNNAFERTRYASDRLNPQDDDFLDDLELLKNNSVDGYYASNENDEDYSGTKFAENVSQTPSQTQPEFSLDDENFNDDELDFEHEDDFETDEETTQNETHEDFSTSDFSQFDSIISQNVNDYTMQSNMFNDNDFKDYVRTENYKDKLSNLNEYAKNSEEKPAQKQPATGNSVNFTELKKEFEKEGIEIKPFKKYYRSDEAVKSYLLINKINLINSLILFFGFLLIMSAVYIILRNTDYGRSFDLNYKYFLIGMIPFAIYLLTYLMIYLISPYRKVTAKFAPRIMLFISIIITVQLLLITYCVNLQLGFYSFTQANYNHLLWIIPTIISFAPIVNNIIYMSLYYSKNFNI